jgi:hypothetical protein
MVKSADHSNALGPSIEFNDFTGGLNTFDPEYLLPLNQSPDLDNIEILDKGFKKRFGDSAWNSSAMVSGSTAIQGAGYIQFDSGSQFLNAVAGTKFFTDSGLSGTMADATGAITITSGQNNIWTPNIFNNIQIWFGGAPDAPFKYSGSGNAAALGGTPPSAYTAFVANNRIFAISTAANPSRIQWPIVSNPEDWTGSGSGSADVNKSDGEALQCGVVVGADTAILFKNSSTHLMVLTRQPFPIYQLQKGIGIAGRNAWASANGVVYFVTPGRRMRSTQDGINFQEYPNDINDIWDSINTNRIAYIQGMYYQAMEWIIFVVSTGSSTTNNYAIIWDMRHKCFLRCTTGYKANIMTTVQNRRLFAGHYNGKLYEKDKSSTYTDSSEASPFAIDGYWRTPFKNLGGLDTTIHPLYLTISALNETASTLEISYGFDFTSAQTVQTSSLQAVGARWDVDQWDQGVWGGQNAVAPRIFIYGRGNLFSFKMRNATASQGYTIQGASVRLRPDKSRKVLAGI